MSNYKSDILNHLITRYENKKSLRNIYLKINKLYPFYGKSDSFYQSDVIDKDLDELINIGFLNVGRSNDFGNREISLNQEAEVLDDIYRYLNREKKQDIKNILISEINTKVINEDEFISAFTSYILDCLHTNKSLAPYLENNSLDDLNNVLKILISMSKQNEEISFRKFSILVFSNSKKLDYYKKKVFNIIKDFFDDSIEDIYQAFECFNIYRNPSYIYLKGNIELEINTQVINLKYLDNTFILSSKNIEKVKIKESYINKIITVENLTSFYDLEDDKSLIIYLGGFHNKIKQVFLQMLYEYYQESVEYLHFGDIDAGGFYIYLNLVTKTNIAFKTFKMDIETLEKNLKYTKKLTKSDVVRLNKLKEQFSDPVIDYMLKHNVKLEQEIVE